MYVSVVTILVSWIIFSTILVTLILINSARISHTDDPETGTGKSAGELRKKKVELMS